MSRESRSNTRRQGVFWLLTIPANDWTPPDIFPGSIVWIRGQREVGESGYEHWQLFVAFSPKKSLNQVKEIFTSTTHAELSRSAAAEVYVCKDETAVPGTRFEYGAKPIRRNVKTDWESVWTTAKSGALESIPASIRVGSYRTLQAIAADYSTPQALERKCTVFWGKTGTGKSRRAWEEAGLDAYCKDPRTKFWCGYQSQVKVTNTEECCYR